MYYLTADFAPYPPTYGRNPSPDLGKKRQKKSVKAAEIRLKTYKKVCFRGDFRGGRDASVGEKYNTVYPSLKNVTDSNDWRGGHYGYSYKNNILEMNFLEIFPNEKVEYIKCRYHVLGDTLVISGEKEFHIYPETPIPEKHKKDSADIQCFKTTMYFIKNQKSWIDYY